MVDGKDTLVNYNDENERNETKRNRDKHTEDREETYEKSNRNSMNG